jgi:hypothetical protein
MRSRNGLRSGVYPMAPVASVTSIVAIVDPGPDPRHVEEPVTNGCPCYFCRAGHDPVLSAHQRTGVFAPLTPGGGHAGLVSTRAARAPATRMARTAAAFTQRAG